MSRVSLQAWSTAALLLGCSAAGADTSASPRAGAGGATVGGAPASQAGGAGAAGAGGSMLGITVPLPGQAGAPASCASVTQTAQNTRQAADIIMAVDNGPNMQSGIQNVRDRLDAFSKQIVGSGVDANIILISQALNPDVVSAATPLGGPSGGWRAICVGAPLGSGQCPLDSKPPSFHHLDEEVGAGHGLIPTPERHPLNLFTLLYPKYQGFLRPSAAKTFVVITDQNATVGPNNSPRAFGAAVHAMDAVMFPAFRVSSIVAYSACSQFLFPSVPGTVYLDLAKQTGGVSGDFCSSNFAPVFDDVARGIVGFSQLECQWAIPPAPAGQTLDPGRVNVVLTSAAGRAPIGQVSSAADCARAAGGWYYDVAQAPTHVLACPTSCDAIRGTAGATIDVQFGCETVHAELR